MATELRDQSCNLNLARVPVEQGRHRCRTELRSVGVRGPVATAAAAVEWRGERVCCWEVAGGVKKPDGGGEATEKVTLRAFLP
jgi:hypothetical protein